jgi:hypothetical protein
MANLLNSHETPNLLELVESHRSGLQTWNQSVCADEFTQPPVEQSVCSDEGGLAPPSEQSVCADEGGPAETSDFRLKTDIEQVGTTVYGLPLYHFRYKTGTERFQGVMAQDVLDVMPGAVVMGEGGYYRVKYGELGIRMTRA